MNGTMDKLPSCLQYDIFGALVVTSPRWLKITGATEITQQV